MRRRVADANRLERFAPYVAHMRAVRPDVGEFGAWRLPGRRVRRPVWTIAPLIAGFR